MAQPMRSSGPSAIEYIKYFEGKGATDFDGAFVEASVYSNLEAQKWLYDKCVKEETLEAAFERLSSLGPWDEEDENWRASMNFLEEKKRLTHYRRIFQRWFRLFKVVNFWIKAVGENQGAIDGPVGKRARIEYGRGKF